MTEQPTELDEHRGMAAQKATLLRRERAEVEADQAQLQHRQAELEENLLALPAMTWAEAATKARYLLSQYAGSVGIDPRQRRLVENVLADFDRLQQRQAD